MTIVTTQDDLANRTSEKRGTWLRQQWVGGTFLLLLLLLLRRVLLLALNQTAERVPDQSCLLLLSIFATRERETERQRERVTITQRLFCSCVVCD
jgi:hypothetical protein